MNLHRLAPSLFCLATLLALAGCDSTNQFFSENGTADQPSAEGQIYLSRVDLAPFYRYGPAQASSPDWHVRRGQEVTMIQESPGFSRVRLPSGMVGWVNTGDFEPKDGSALADDSSAPKRQSTGRESGEGEFVPPSDPAREMPMPEPVEPPPGIPEFRI